VSHIVEIVLDYATAKALRNLKSFGTVHKAAMGKVEGEIKATGAATARTNKSLGNMTSMLAGAAWIYGVSRLKSAAVEMMNAAQVQELAEARVGAVLKATGGKIGMQVGQLKDMASGLQKTTMFGDEDVLNAEAMLMTFKGITQDIFPETLSLAADIASTFGTDLRSAILQVGKAVEDPSYGFTQLRRVGVSFTEEQGEMIKKFTKMGEVAKAQAVVLEVLRTQIGGVSEAIAATNTGKYVQLKNVIGDIKETIGAGLLDGIIKVADGWNLGADSLARINQESGPLIQGWFSGAVQDAGIAAKYLWTNLQADAEAVRNIFSPSTIDAIREERDAVLKDAEAMVILRDATKEYARIKSEMDANNRVRQMQANRFATQIRQWVEESGGVDNMKLAQDMKDMIERAITRKVQGDVWRSMQLMQRMRGKK